jgi:RyR domain
VTFPADACQEFDERDRRATALAWLGWAHSRVLGHRSQARACLELAVELAPENPYHLVAFVELDMIASGTHEHLSLLAPSLRQAAGRCEEHVRAGVEVTRSWLTLAKLRFLLDDAFSAFEALCLGARAASTHHPLTELVHSFEQLGDAISGKRPSIQWLCAGAQLLAKTKELNTAPEAATVDLQPLVRKFEFDPTQPVTIFAGATADSEATRLGSYEPLLLDGLAGQRDVFISGGTTAGICGLVGRVSTRLKAATAGAIRLVGYIPETLPPGASVDPSYQAIVRTDGTTDFSPLEPIQMWTDLLLSGVKLQDVRLFCLGGGELSAAELHLAWALGARSAVVTDGSIAAERFSAVFSGPWSCGQLSCGPWSRSQWSPALLLPDDPATITAFFAFDAPIDPKQWEKSGEAVHQTYLKSQQKGARQPNFLPWPLLREDFKHSNRHQAACSVEILRRCGFIVEPTQQPLDKIPLTEFTKEQVEQLAEWEHGRWTVERLKAGWRYGEKKDEGRRFSPYLVSWKLLPEAIQNYDRDAVRDWPAILVQAGWQVR